MSVTYSQIKNQTLKLIDEYSSRGSVVTAQSKIGDILLKIQGAVNEAQYDLAKSKAKIPAVYTFTRAAETDAVEYSVPSDLREFNYLTVKYDDSDNYQYYNSFYSPPNGKIIVNKYIYPATFDFHYFKKPTMLTFTNTSADDSLTFDIDDDAALIMPYYIAGQVLSSEGDLAKSAYYMNQYYQKKAELDSPFYHLGGTVINVTGW